MCDREFASKRKSAVYCSARCQDRARERPYDPEYRRHYYARTKDQRAPRDRKTARTRATALRKWLGDYKRAVGCADCGFRDPRALDFDHVAGVKTINISFAKSIAQAQTEIAKCVVRCSNCHRIRTWERLQARKSAEKYQV